MIFQAAMQSTSEIHAVLDILGLVISLPVLTVLGMITRFLYQIKGTAETAAKDIKNKTEADKHFDTRMLRMIDRLERRIDRAESRLDVWDGKTERRSSSHNSHSEIDEYDDLDMDNN